MDAREHNRIAWDRQVELDNEWTRPVSSEDVAAARRGEWTIRVTSRKAVPRDWIPDVADRDILCLAAGGGQQAPILAAAGARITVLDNSPRQLEQDRHVAERDDLEIITVLGDMTDLHMFADRQFDVIVHPVSNVFVSDIIPVWREAYRVVRPGGVLIAGFVNPAVYLFDHDAAEQTGKLEVVHGLPYSDVDSMSDATIRRLAGRSADK